VFSNTECRWKYSRLVKNILYADREQHGQHAKYNKALFYALFL